jgi:glucan phosphorylase
MNGALLLGSKDSTNMSISKHIGPDNITLFGDEIHEIWRKTK